MAISGRILVHSWEETLKDTPKEATLRIPIPQAKKQGGEFLGMWSIVSKVDSNQSPSFGPTGCCVCRDLYEERIIDYRNRHCDAGRWFCALCVQTLSIHPEQISRDPERVLSGGWIEQEQPGPRLRCQVMGHMAGQQAAEMG